MASHLKRNFNYTPGTVSLPEGPGKAELIALCSKCHARDIVVTRDGKEGLRSQSADTIDRMIRKGAEGTDEQYKLIEDYLAANFGYIPVVSNLPQGPAKSVLERDCGACHGLALFTGRHATREQWGGTIENMMGRGAKVTPEVFYLMADYLTNFFGSANGSPVRE